MERRFAARRDQLLADAEVDPRILRGVLPRLERFLDPFVERLQRSEQGVHARTYVAGLLSDLEYKNVESIAYLHDQEREPVAKVHRPVALGPPALAHRVGPPGRPELAAPTACSSSTPRPSPRRATLGRGAAAVVRPLGKIDNCQVGIYLAYVGPAAARPGRCPPVPAQGVGQGQAAAYPGGRPTAASASARGTN